MTTRRTFLKYSALSIGAFAVGPEFGAFAADVRPLIEGVAQACRRLAPLGGGEMLKDAPGGQLDIAAADLKDELNKPLAIDRTYPGFGDFALSATRAVEPGIPDRSLLYQRSLRPPSLRTGRVSILEDSRLWRRWMRSRIMSTAPNHRPSMLFGRASMRCLRRSRVERRGESSVSWFTPCNIVTRRCPCMGAMPNSASLVRRRKAGNHRTALRCASTQFRLVGPGAAFRISRRAASFRGVSCSRVQGAERSWASGSFARR